ncbi:DUF6113 family protein [Spirillospora albida]|uniref:DUF6113 family protein n=1 Tax=Spirillospora albida TaxID=58123 RepID=UPI00069040E9|nr:DUF6113 family protein [Spirillospora albida]
MDKDDEAPLARSAAPPPAPEPAGADGTLDAFVSGAAYAVLALLGSVVALLGSFCIGWTVAGVPAAAIAAVVVVFGLVRAAGWGMGGRLGALIPAVVWGLVVFVMSMRRPEGDLVVPATVAGYIYIIGGMVAAVIGVARVPSARPSGEWLTGRAARPRG